MKKFLFSLAMLMMTAAAWADVIPATKADVGKVLCSDGSIYATVSEATAAGKTAQAMIAYVDDEFGTALGISLEDGPISEADKILSKPQPMKAPKEEVRLRHYGKLVGELFKKLKVMTHLKILIRLIPSTDLPLHIMTITGLSILH